MVTTRAATAITGFLIAIVLIVGTMLYTAREQTADVTITNFDECVAAGGQMLETYPPQCRTASGATFTQDIGNALEISDRIHVTSPRPNAAIANPLTVTGEARGTWFFEATFPVRIEREDGTVLVQHYAQAQGEWMTENFVPFTATLTFDAPTSGRGTLILERSNPSDLPEHDAELRIPITFAGTAQRSVTLHYYNAARDRDASGNIQCSRAGIVPVERTIPRTITPIQDTVRALLAGDLTAQERAAGITTEFPLEQLTLRAASLDSGLLTLTLNDPLGNTSGGACRAGILWLQIEQTALQFPEVTRVRFEPDALFQP
ncbi:MAG: Gmad2 immunoglobulin-like domain-containing protein [bacterium]|nr:Gmad2 immunoglobulin-like domain-containing protein [bacterium]